MTRVSDQPGFAAAVAEAGALPFLALALANARADARLLDPDARTRSATRPWGVGILGFAAEDARAAQLAVIRELRPHARDHRGRPARAGRGAGSRPDRDLPARALARPAGQFLTAGAPQVRLRGRRVRRARRPAHQLPAVGGAARACSRIPGRAPGAGDAEVLFAGGVHDARSAAMVAALAAPLAGRGAAVGVLMGTAYLFTEEAVAAGAIQPLFQRQVLAAEHTDLLETAPGHATRCVRSPFTDDFAAIKARAGRATASPTGTRGSGWNSSTSAGCASPARGSSASATTCVAVGEDRQLAEGMFMAGEVAVLRSAVDHDRGAAPRGRRRRDGRSCGRPAHCGARCRRRRNRPAPAPLDIAIVGMACMFPRRADLAAFWANVLRGADAVTEVPAAALGPAAATTSRTATASGRRRAGAGSCPRSPFDPLRYGIPPSSLASIEPVQLLALEAARRALADAGLRRARVRPRADVGGVRRRGGQRPVQRDARCAPCCRPTSANCRPSWTSSCRELTEDSFPGMLANVIAGPHRQPARPRRRQLHGGRRLRVLAGRGRRGVQGADRGHQRPGALRWRGPAQRHQRLPAVLLGARAVADRPLARRSTRPPTASRSARASRASC